MVMALDFVDDAREQLFRGTRKKADRSEYASNVQ